MLFHPEQDGPHDGLWEQVRRADGVTPELMARVMAQACGCAARLNSSQKDDRVHQLIAAQAWTDAALALIEFELPRWKLRRLAHEDGEWHCSLCKHWQLPDWLDDAVEARHEVLPLAILSAFLEARRTTSAGRETSSSTVPQVRPTSGYAVCCDNFA